MKVKKTYSIERKLAIEIDIRAAKAQVSSSSIVETAVKNFLQSKVDLEKKSA